MTTSSEDVLLQMGEVRFKKGDGTLYVMNERVAWMAENRDTVAVSHRYQDIKMQKISPDGKPKVQLQVVLHDGNSSTFHFVNRNGLQAQLIDRDKVKELLQQLLPNFKRKVDKELEEKNRILSDNPHLLQLYKDLVITQVLTSEEFWETHAKDYAQKNNTKKQEIGVSGAFLADIKPQTDGCNGLKYNLTADIIHCIFKTYPAVKRKHNEHVPSKLTESEFWTKFFQSHYFHRDRITAGTKDIFTECGKIDDQTLKLAVLQGSGDPLLDLKQFEDVTLEDGFASAPSDRTSVNSGNIVHQSMIKRFNQHSIMVLQTCTNVNNNNQESTSSLSSNFKSSTSTTIDSNKNDLNLNGIKDKNKNKLNNINNICHNNTNNINNNSYNSNPASRRSSIDSTISSSSPNKSKRRRLIDKISYDDLGTPICDTELDIITTNSNKNQLNIGNHLNLDKVERYLHGPVPITYYDNVDEPQGLDITQYQLSQETQFWSQRTPHKVLVSAKSAVNALGELSPGGALMRGFQEQSSQLVPPEFEKDLRNLYLSLSELLKHFWSAFPPTTSELESRAIRMHEALQRFKIAKLTVFEDRAMRELSPLGASLTLHLNQLLQSAGRKFATWQDRKIRQHR